MDTTTPVHEAHVDDSVVPGTVHLVDLEHTLLTKHASGAKQDVVLVPTPSADPNDPLNWSPRRKFLSTFSWIVYVWFTGIASSAVYSVEVELSEAIDTPIATLNAGTGYLFLLAGWGLLFWQPFALQYGKRPAYMLSTIGVLAITIWSPWAGGSQWYARCVLGGFLNAPIEALPELSVTDIYFAHERGMYMGLYAGVLVASNFFAPIICGWINVGLGYKWVFGFPSIFLVFALIFQFFFMEETNYDRKSVGIIVDPDSDTLTGSTADPEKTVGQSTTPASPAEYREKTYREKLRLWDPPRPNLMFYRIKMQLRFLTWPVVVWCGFAYGSTVICEFNVLNGTASLILTAAPYNFSSGLVGTSYIACIIGVCLGFAFTGQISDWFVLKMARRNNGVVESESRLWLFLLPSILIPFALILWGVGAAQQVHWFGLIFAMVVLAFVNTCGAALSMTYLVDSYREISGDAVATVIFVRNTMSFAIGYGITPWIDGMGLQNAFITAAFIGLVCCMSFLIMIKWGKQLRERTRVQYYEIIKANIERGAIH